MAVMEMICYTHLYSLSVFDSRDVALKRLGVDIVRCASEVERRPTQSFLERRELTNKCLVIYF